MVNGTEIYKTIINDANADSNASVKYEMAPAHVPSLKMVNHFHPWSITPGEFEYMHDFIVSNNLKVGYECATAFGISGLATAMAFKKTGGKLVTVDAYIEEKYNEAGAYKALKEINTNDPDGLRSLRWLLNRFDVNGVVIPFTGWSPDNVADVITDGHGVGASVDFAFIDAGHWDSAAIADITAVRTFIDTSKPYAVFFHDLHCFTNALWNTLERQFQRKMQPIHTIRQSWGMGVVTNIENVNSIIVF
jgi:hypothetical protein